MTTPELTAFKLPRIRYWRELSIIALMVMELAWVVPWYRSLTPATYAVSLWRAFFVLAGIILLANISTRAMNFLDIKISIRRFVVIGLILLSVFIGLRLLLYDTEPFLISEMVNRPLRAFSEAGRVIPDEFLVIIIVLVIFWRGLSLASKFIDPVSVRRNFYLGLIMFVSFIFINTIVTGETPGVMLYVFFVSALIALGSARIFTITQLRGGARNPFDLRWFLGIITTALLIVGIAGLVAWLFGERTSLLSGIGTFLMGAFGILMLLLISPLIFLMERLSPAMPGVSAAFDNVIAALEDLSNTFRGIANNLFGMFDVPSLAERMQQLKPFMLWGFVAAVAVIIVFSISRWLFNERAGRRDDLESVIEPGDIPRMLRQVFQERLDDLLNAFRSRSGILNGRRWLAAAKIRRIYAQLMELSARLDEPRPPSHTPIEHLPVLEGLFPQGKEDVEIITEAYLKVRYGELPESIEEVNTVEAAWQHLKMLGKEKYSQLSKEKKKNKV